MSASLLQFLHRARSWHSSPLHGKVDAFEAGLCSWLTAINYKCIVEGDSSLRRVPVEGQRDKHFRWNMLKHKLWGVREPELWVVLGMSDKATSPSVHGSKSQQPFLDQGLADSLSLILRQYRDGSKSIPVWRAIGKGHG